MQTHSHTYIMAETVHFKRHVVMPVMDEQDATRLHILPCTTGLWQNCHT